MSQHQSCACLLPASPSTLGLLALQACCNHTRCTHAEASTWCLRPPCLLPACLCPQEVTAQRQGPLGAHAPAGLARHTDGVLHTGLAQHAGAGGRRACWAAGVVLPACSAHGAADGAAAQVPALALLTLGASGRLCCYATVLYRPSPSGAAVSACHPITPALC